MISDGVAEKITISLFLARLLFIPNHHPNICSGDEGYGDKKKNGGSHAFAKFRRRVKNGNTKSAVGDEQRLVRPVDEILAEAAGKEFHHAAFAMCA